MAGAVLCIFNWNSRVRNTASRRRDIRAATLSRNVARSRMCGLIQKPDTYGMQKLGLDLLRAGGSRIGCRRCVRSYGAPLRARLLDRIVWLRRFAALATHDPVESREIRALAPFCCCGSGFGRIASYVMPPRATVIASPFTPPAASLHRNAITCATSRGSSTRFCG